MELITYDAGDIMQMGYILPIDCTINGKRYKGEVGIRADIRKHYLLPKDNREFNVSHRVIMWISYDKKVQRNFIFYGRIDGKEWKGYEYVNGRTIAGFVLKEIAGFRAIEKDSTDCATNKVNEWKHFICEKEIEDILYNELSKITNSAE